MPSQARPESSALLLDGQLATLAQIRRRFALANERADRAREALVAVHSRPGDDLSIRRWPRRDEGGELGRLGITGESIQSTEEVSDGGEVPVVTFELEGGGEGDTDEDFEVVGEAGDEGEELLGDGHLASARLLRVREEGEEVDHLFAEKSSFSDVRDFCGCQIPSAIHPTPSIDTRLTLGSDLLELNRQIVDGREQRLDVQDELLRHPHSLDVLARADVPQHLRDARCTALLER